MYKRLHTFLIVSITVWMTMWISPCFKIPCENITAVNASKGDMNSM